MKSTRQTHQAMLDFLHEKRFERLVIKRYGSKCYLIISADKEDHVFLNDSGEKMIYRHGWQIKDWLTKSFNIGLNQSV
jgi:hypothetical protein